VLDMSYATKESRALSLPDALPILGPGGGGLRPEAARRSVDEPGLRLGPGAGPCPGRARRGSLWGAGRVRAAGAGGRGAAGAADALIVVLPLPMGGGARHGRA